MVFLPWAEIEEGASAAQPAVIGSAIAAAQSFACGLYKDYPEFMSNSGPLDPLAGLKRGIWDKICPNQPPPPTPTPPSWDGSTCACRNYNVPWRTLDGDVPIFVGASINVTGPIFGLEKIDQGNGTIATNLKHGQCDGSGNFTGVTSTGLVIGGTQIKVFLQTPTLLPNQPPGCNPPSNPPPPTPPPPERQAERGDINISPNIDVNVPIILVRPEISVDINPSIEIGVGPFNVNFDAGGITVNLNPSFDLPPLPVPIPLPPPPIPRPPSLPPSGGDCPDPCEEFDYERIEDAIRNERKYYAQSKQEIEEENLGSGRSGDVEISPEAIYIRVQITQRPSQIKSQAGIDAPDVLFAGWCSWGLEHPGIRYPIHYDTQVFPIGERSTRFTWTLYEGGSATITEIKLKNLEECETNECR